MTAGDSRGSTRGGVVDGRSALQRRLLAAQPWTAVAERDLSYLRVSAAGGPDAAGPDDEVLVVACDSDGGLGPKPADTVPVDGVVLGRFATRVPLLECVAAGAAPVLVVDTLTVELDPTGASILVGVREEAAEAGLPASAVTGSTEDNVSTVATGIGVTVLGRCRLGDLRAGTTRRPFAVLLLGRPMSAPADRFGPDHPEVLNVPALVAALGVDGVGEALPIGSGGVFHEYQQLALSVGASPRPRFDRWPVGRDQSGGPSTACLLAVELTPRTRTEHGDDHVADVAAEVARVADLPVWYLGTAG